MKTTPLKFIITGAIAALLLPSLASADTLILGGGAPSSYLTDVQAKITSTGVLSGAINVFDWTTTVPTLSQLQTYSSVVLFTDGNGSPDKATMGNRLADYVDLGGGVVICTFATGSLPLQGRWASANYDPFEPASQSSGTNLTLGTRYLPAHPLFTGVNTFNGGSSSYDSTGTLNPAAIRLADWSNGLVFAAELNTFNGKIIALNFYPPSSDARADFWTASTDGEFLLANGAKYVASVPEPTSGALLVSSAIFSLVLRRRKSA